MWLHKKNGQNQKLIFEREVRSSLIIGKVSLQQVEIMAKTYDEKYYGRTSEDSRKPPSEEQERRQDFKLWGQIVDVLENYLLNKVFKTDMMTRSLHDIVTESDSTRI